ncbi:hypothetical protein MRB53_038217 [Persea americana]|nr:hypothetical protein MRB53_038217 [Persea americana]
MENSGVQLTTVHCNVEKASEHEDKASSQEARAKKSTCSALKAASMISMVYNRNSGNVTAVMCFNKNDIWKQYKIAGY